MTTVHRWLSQPLPDDVARAIDRLASTEDVVRVAIMPDVHLAEDVCVGTVVATRHSILPSAVGGDIGCGMAAIRFEGDAGLLADERAAAAVLHGLAQAIPAARHHTPPDLPAELLDASLGAPALDTLRRREGRYEFATLGRGNHFVELQADEEEGLWLMLHSGSRAMGPAIREHYTRYARETSTGLRVLEAESDVGRAYLHDLAWALAWAEASRRAMLEAAADVLARVLGVATQPAMLVTCQHNHVRREEHFGETLWVHRKGAISADVGERGVIPGSMGTPSHHVVGRGAPDALRSASHGAGRVMSRTEARRRVGRRDFERALHGVWFDHRLADRLRDEAPAAYKDLRGVMRAQQLLVRVERTLRPLLSYKGT